MLPHSKCNHAGKISTECKGKLKEQKIKTNPQSNTESAERVIEKQKIKVNKTEAGLENQSLQLSASEQISLPPSPSPIKILQRATKNLPIGNKQFEADGYQYDQFQEISENQSLLKILEKDSKSSSKINEEKCKIQTHTDKSASLFDDQSESNLLDCSIKAKESICLNDKNSSKLTTHKNEKSQKSRPPVPPNQSFSPTLAESIRQKLKQNIDEINQQQIIYETQSKCLSKIKNSRHVTGSSRQIIHQAEIIELQMKCSYLMGVIHKLNKQIVDSNGKKLQINLSESIKNMYTSNNDNGNENIVLFASHLTKPRDGYQQQKSTQIDQPSLSINSEQNVSNNMQDISDISRDGSEFHQSQHFSATYIEQIQCFNQLQSYVQAYKIQLDNYQNFVTQLQRQCKEKVQHLEKQVKLYQKQIEKNQNDLQKKQKEIQKKQNELEKQKKCNKEMVQKNQQLIIQMEKMIENKNRGLIEKVPYYEGKNYERKGNNSKNKRMHRYQTMSDQNQSYSQEYQVSQSSNSPPSPISYFCQKNAPEQLDISVNSKYSHMYRHPFTLNFSPGQAKERSKQSFSLIEYQQCLKEMETIIEKLVKNLQYELKYKDQLIKQINRLCQCVKKSQTEIKNKNQRIYELEKELLLNQVQQMKKSKKISFSSCQTRSQSQPQYNDMYGLSQSLGCQNQINQIFSHLSHNFRGNALKIKRDEKIGVQNHSSLLDEEINKTYKLKNSKNWQHYEQYMNKNTYHKTNNSNANGNGKIMNEYNEYCWTQSNVNGNHKSSNMNKNNGENNLNRAENQMYQINKPRPSLNNGINDNDGQMERQKYIFINGGKGSMSSQNRLTNSNQSYFNGGRRNFNNMVQSNKK